jgi:hypothetical protein
VQTGFFQAGRGGGTKKTGVDFVHARRPSKEEDETVKPDALPDLA